MAKKRIPEEIPPEKVDIIIESQQWESTTSAPIRFTWRHGLILALIIAGAIVFAFGFLFIAGIIILAAIVVNIISVIVRKLT